METLYYWNQCAIILANILVVSRKLIDLFSFVHTVNGNVKQELVTNKTSQQIAELITKMANQSGLDIIRIRKPFHTDSPSIQGQWHPFTNRPPSTKPIGPQDK